MSTGLPQHFHRSSRRRRCSFKTQPKLIFFMTPPSIKNNPVSSSTRMGEKSPEPSAPPQPHAAAKLAELHGWKQRMQTDQGLFLHGPRHSCVPAAPGGVHTKPFTD